MQEKDSNNINHRLTDKIINVAYGDAGIIDRLFIFWKVSLNRDIKNLFNEYKATAKAVHSVKPEDVPVDLTQSFKNRIISAEPSRFFTSVFSYFFYLLFGKKAIPAFLLGVILLIIVSFLIFKEPSHKYTNAEIELAEKQFKQTLAIVGKAFEKAEKSFSKDILEKQINKKLNKGYYLVNNILIGG